MVGIARYAANLLISPGVIDCPNNCFCEFKPSSNSSLHRGSRPITPISSASQAEERFELTSIRLVKGEVQNVSSHRFVV